VIAIERDEDGELLGRAKGLGIPVLVGRGSDRSLMSRVSLPKARAVAAVTSDDLENIAVAMAARSVHREIRVVLRVGDGVVANETRSLLPLGLVRDVHRIAAALLAAMAVGQEAESVICLGEGTHLRFPDGRLECTELETLAGSGGDASGASSG
jgi:Trk K+ transport system NAD-binding subunit